MKNNEITFVGKQKKLFLVLTMTGPAVAKSGFPCLLNFIGNDFYDVACSIKKEQVEERRYRSG